MEENTMTILNRRRELADRTAPEPDAGTEPAITEAADEPDTTTPLADTATADEIAAAVERHRQGAELAAGRAALARGDAEDLMAGARKAAARLIAEAEAAGRPLVKAADAGEREAAMLAGRAQLLGNGVASAAKAEEAEARAKALEDERADLAANLADLGSRLAELAADRREADAKLTAAREAADLEQMTTLRNRIDSIDSLADDLRGKQAPMTARLAEIGDGTETFVTHPLLRAIPPLAKARQAARSERHSLRQVLNQAFPDRPEAVLDHNREELRLTIEAQRARIAEEAAAQQKPPQPRTFVHL